MTEDARSAFKAVETITFKHFLKRFMSAAAPVYPEYSDGSTQPVYFHINDIWYIPFDVIELHFGVFNW